MSNLYPDLYRTKFPNEIDSFVEFLDIVASDGDDIKRYQDAIHNGNFVLANQILQGIPSYNRKVLTAQDLNKFLNIAEALERFYRNDIMPFVEGKQIEWEIIINQFTYKGVYSPSSIYKQDNYVSFGVGADKNLYIALQNVPQGTPPSNTTYWRQLSTQGATGESGIGLAFTGEWDGSVTYKVNDCVEYDGALWNSLQTNTGQIPVEGSLYWKLVKRIGTTVYPVTTTKPPKQQNGELWFKVV